MRVAELVMALAMAAFSISLMVMATELPIGWIPKSGPGGGAFPFWLAAGMLVCCMAIIWRWWRRASPPSRSTEPYFDPHSLRLFIIGAVPLGIMIGIMQVLGLYVALPLYLIYYIRFVGNHPWPLTLAIGLSAPVITFLFFEIALKIELPKGYTEPLFYPIYDLFY